MIGDHPDIASALRSGHPVSKPRQAVPCPGCLAEIYDGDLIETGCGWRVCKECLNHCDGCEDRVGCCLCSD